MPKLLVFAPCEKVIISQDENTPTLIAILSDISGVYKADQKLEAGTLAPLRWSVFTMWSQEPTDDGKVFQLNIRLVSPSPANKVILHVVSDFTMTAPAHRQTGQLHAIPVGQNGRWSIDLYLREKGAPDWPATPLASYPLTITFNAEQPTATPS